MCTTDDIFANLQDDLDTAILPSPNRPPVPKHPCGQCGGSGRWSGGINRYGSRHCFACKGKGYFKSSQADRQKARDQARARKARKVVDAQQAFAEQHPGLIEALSEVMGWNSFAGDLVRKYAEYGSLTDNQVSAAQRMLVKIKARNEQRDAEKAQREATAATVDLSAIRAMFETAQANGVRRPVYRARDLVISLAGQNSRNAGCIYVKTAGGDYQGKITPKHKFLAIREARDTTEAALLEIAQDPRAAAVQYGHDIGSCSVCGRTLTNKSSIEAGIGPICASKWGW